MRFDFELLKGVVVCLGLPIIPFMGTTAVSMFYHFVLSFLGYSYDLNESFERSVAFAFKPTMYFYYFIWISILLVIFGVEIPSV